MSSLQPVPMGPVGTAEVAGPDNGSTNVAHCNAPKADVELLEDLRTAFISRLLDDREIALQKQGRVFFQISGAGHEALCLALARSLRPGHDWFFPYYRDRSLCLALGVTPEAMLLQAVGAAADPSSAGRQMPCHWGDPGLHIVSQTSPTGSQCLPAIGCAEAGRYLVHHAELLTGTADAAPDEITYVSLGEGATSQGEFWESLNTACTLRLPVLYVVADNGWAISVPAVQQQPAPVFELVKGFEGLEVAAFDGCSYEESRQIGAQAIDYLRTGAGPVLLHAAVTRPYSHSAADTQSKYRTPDDLTRETDRDPISSMTELVLRRGLLDRDGVEAMRAEAASIVEMATENALASPPPDPHGVTHHLVSPGVATASSATPVSPPLEDLPDGEGTVMAEAIGRCLHEVMAADPRVRVFGEDVADAPPSALGTVPGKGGVFGTTFGLQSTFGSDRCYNSPLAEANIIGRAIGQALRGLRPSPEIQFFDYIWTAMSQLRSELATLRWRSAGSFSAPMVIRVPIGGYLTGGAIWHSQSGESIFAHIPGLLIAMPSRAADAVGLLRTAFAGDDPVLFLEHKHLYRQPYARDPYPPPGWTLPFGQAALRRRPAESTADATIVTWGAMVQRSLDAAERLEEDGIETEVLDLRTIVPWDRQAVTDSVARTGRLIVVHEDVGTAGFGAEIAAWVAGECFHLLRAPIARVTALDTPVAYSPALEAVILPQVDDVVEAVRSLTVD